MKQATTVEEQIKILTNRGMLIDMPEEKAKEILGDIGYFRLGFYCFPFETSYPDKKHRSHKYKQSTKFSDAVNLYYFDVDLRNILSKYIYRVEVNFRTNVVYRVSNKYKHCNTWFADPAIMEREFIAKFDNEFYTDIFRKKPIIRNHHRKYINDKYAPAWKTLEFFTFGEILSVYQNLKDLNLKKEIAGQYGIRSIKIMENYMFAIKEIRNLCAHGGVMYDHSLIRTTLIPGLPVNIDNKDKSKIFSVIRIIEFLLGSISKNRFADLKNELDKLFEQQKNNSVVYSILIHCVGYKKII